MTHHFAPPHTAAVLAVLKDCARDMRTVNYEDLVAGTDLDVTDVGKPLDYIRASLCLPQERPLLTLLAVNKRTHRPSPASDPNNLVGFLGDRWWREMVAAVYAHDWSEVELDLAAC